MRSLMGLWCLFVGHKRWQFTRDHPVMAFIQDDTIGNEIYHVDICERCDSLYTLRVE